MTEREGESVQECRGHVSAAAAAAKTLIAHEKDSIVPVMAVKG